MDIGRVIQNEPWLEIVLVELPKCFWVCAFHALEASGQFLIRLSQLVRPVCIGAILTIVALLGLFKVLAHLRLEVVVGNVHHFVFHINGEVLVSPPQFEITVSVMA